MVGGLRQAQALKILAVAVQPIDDVQQFLKGMDQELGLT